jgi:hypothetical protein
MIPYTYHFSEYPSSEQLEPGKLSERLAADPNLPALTIGYNDAEEVVTYLAPTPLTTQQIAALDSHVASYVHETLPEARARCVAACRAHRLKKLEPPENGGRTVEYPPGSGKIWALSSGALQNWLTLYQERANLSYPYVVVTHDGSMDHVVSDQTALEVICAQIRSLVLVDSEARRDVYQAIRAAGSISEANDAMVAYLAT